MTALPEPEMPAPLPYRPLGEGRTVSEVEHEAHIAVRAWGLLTLDGEGASGGRLAALVAERFPSHAIVLAGRSYADGRADSGWRWLIDDDGERGTVLAVALLHAGLRRVGMVVDPASGSVISARRDGGIYLDPPGRRVVLEPPSGTTGTRLFLEMGADSRSPELLTALAQVRSSRPMTTRILATAAVALAEAALAGGTFVGIGLQAWQVAAGLLVAEESGLVVRTWSDDAGLSVIAAPIAEIHAISAALSR